MSQLLLFFWQLCLLRTSPERAPVSTGSMSFIFIIYVITSTTLMSISRSGNRFSDAIQLVLLGIVVQLSCIWMLLIYKRVSYRFPATLVALLGTNSLLIVFMIPLNLVMLAIDGHTLDLLMETFYWILFFWWIAVEGFILYKTINVSLMLGITLAFTIELVSLITTSTFLPTSVQTISQS